EYPQHIDWESIEGRDLYLGVDIGRKRDLTVAWLLERLGDVLYTRRVVRLRNMPKHEQEKVIWPLIEMCGRTDIDATGLGIGWAADAQRKYGEARVEAVTFTPRVKEELAYPVRGRMQDRTLRIPYDPVIRADL